MDGRRGDSRCPGRAGGGRPQHDRAAGDLRGPARSRALGGALRAGQGAGRAGLRPGYRHARQRRVQAPPGRRTDPPDAAPRRGPHQRRGLSMQVTMTVNGEEVSREIEGRLLLVHFLRDHLGLTGTHWGCDTSNCGTCVVWMDDEPVKSCTVLTAMADGKEVRTVEGLERNGELDPVQQGFMECHGLQCGFCTPGMMMTARWLPERSAVWSTGQRVARVRYSADDAR